MCCYFWGFISGFADRAGGDEGEGWSGAGSGRGPYKEHRGTQ